MRNIRLGIIKYILLLNQAYFFYLLFAQDPYTLTAPVRCPADFESNQSVSICSGDFFIGASTPDNEPTRLTYVEIIKIDDIDK